MSDRPTLYNSVAPLANVAKVTQLIKQLQTRDHTLPRMGCVYGQAGRGKTTAATYAMNSLNVCHVETLPFGGIKRLLEQIVTELGDRPCRTTGDMFAQVADKLARSRRPLIIDEAENVLNDRTIETIRKLHDLSGVPVILMGEEKLPQVLRRWERVDSRIHGAWVGMEDLSKEDVGMLARVYANGLTIAQDVMHALWTASRGSMRRCAANLVEMREHAAVHGLDAITAEAWATRSFDPGEPPVPRQSPVRGFRKGAAA